MVQQLPNMLSTLCNGCLGCHCRLNICLVKVCNLLRQNLVCLAQGSHLFHPVSHNLWARTSLLGMVCCTTDDKVILIHKAINPEMDRVVRESANGVDFSAVDVFCFNTPSFSLNHPECHGETIIPTHIYKRHKSFFDIERNFEPVASAKNAASSGGLLRLLQ